MLVLVKIGVFMLMVRFLNLLNQFISYLISWLFTFFIS
jgi:hypothetical protein